MGTKGIRMAYSWDNRVKFVVRYMYDIDNNGFLDKNDFECLAVRNTVIETKGKWTRECTKRTRKSWPTCGTKSQTSLTSTRMAKYQLKSSIRVLKCLAKESPTQNSPKLSNFSSIARSEQLM